MRQLFDNIFIDAILMAWGRIIFALTAKTPVLSSKAMRRMYRRTNGAIADAELTLLRSLRPVTTRASSGILGKLDKAGIENIATRLHSDGLFVFPQKIPEDICRKLETFARVAPCTAMGHHTAGPYDTNSRSPRHDFAESVLFTSREPCQLALDPLFAAIAGAYFGCRPVFDFATMWWSTPGDPLDYSSAAQLFHYDLDRLNFLKFFVYLTDVGMTNGPHVFTAGSHRSKPEPMRRFGRFQDAEVHAHYELSQLRILCGTRGTVFCADTRGLHKGEPVREGERLVFQIEYAACKFGWFYPETPLSTQQLASLGVTIPIDRRIWRNIRDLRPLSS
jgi:Phytanoyl-CoA dioxygenase (PhyH)